MDEIFDNNIIDQSYYISNKKIYTRNEFCYKISNKVTNFNAEKFAQWMRSNYSKDKFENYVKFSKLVDSNPATISRLMNAKKQTLTNKASQPKRDLVIRLAEAFDASVDEALLLAGHSPINNKIPEAINLVGFDGLDPDDLEDIADYIKFKKSQKK